MDDNPHEVTAFEAEGTKCKNFLTVAAKTSCGVVVCKDRKVRTSWWMNEVSKC